MLFEETVPAGTKSLFHLHHDSDEVAWVLAGEATMLPSAGPAPARSSRATSRMLGRIPAAKPAASAGGYVEELLKRPGSMNEDERNELRERYRWEVVGPNPL